MLVEKLWMTCELLWNVSASERSPLLLHHAAGDAAPGFAGRI